MECMYENYIISGVSWDNIDLTDQNKLNATLTTLINMVFPRQGNRLWLTPETMCECC